MQTALWNDTPQLLDDWVMWMRASGLSERTINERWGTVRKLLDETDSTARTVSTIDIVRYCGRPGLRPATRATYHSTITVFCRWLVLVGARSDDPTGVLKAPKRPRSVARPIPFDQVRSVFRHTRRKRTRAYIMLAVLAGMRINEISKIRGEDVDVKAGTLIITGKGGATELIPLHEELRELAMSYPPSGYWFPPNSGKGHVDRKAVYQAIKRSMIRAGVSTATPHQLRHSYGTELRRSGADLRLIQELMRHANLMSTQIYTGTAWDEKVTALNRLQLVA